MLLLAALSASAQRREPSRVYRPVYILNSKPSNGGGGEREPGVWYPGRGDRMSLADKKMKQSANPYAWSPAGEGGVGGGSRPKGYHLPQKLRMLGANREGGGGSRHQMHEGNSRST